MRIAVFGTGGVGGYFGGRLAQAGEEVAFIARGEHLRAMQTQGLRVESIKGDFALAHVQATDNPAQLGVVDVVFVCVKTWQLPLAAPSLHPLIGPDTCVVPLQNGLEAATQLAAVLRLEAVVGGTCGIYSFISEPGCIRHVGLEPSIIIGELDQRSSERTRALHAVLEHAGIAVAIASNIQIPLWEKFLILRWGVIGAVTRAPAGILRRLPETLDLIDRSCREVVTVARAHDVVLSEDILKRNMALLESLPESATTSFQRDVMDGRPSELDALVNALVRLGEQAQVPTPLHQFFSHGLLPMEMKARGEITFPV